MVLRGRSAGPVVRASLGKAALVRAGREHLALDAAPADSVRAFELKVVAQAAE